VSEGSDDEHLAAYLAEFEFIREGLRQDQRERQAFLGFALAAGGIVLGLLVRSGTTPSSGQALFLIGIVAAIVIVAEVLTMRATIGVASAGIYVRKFVEPHVAGLRFQTRNREFLEHMDARVSASWGFAIAYGTLTAGLVLAWFTIHLSSSRSVYQSALVVILACISVGMTIVLWWTSRYGWKRVERAWDEVKKKEAAIPSQSVPSGGS
jgi:hypothetical protein